MSRVKRLMDVYAKHVAIPWRTDAAAAQRVIFCVYNENDERRLRARIDEFELATRQSGHDWALFDLTQTFAEWMATQKYAENYFRNPQLLQTRLNNYLDYISRQFTQFLTESQAASNSVVAICGVGSLFGFLKVKEVVDQLAPLVSGRLLVFFPGSYENNNYRLLDGYDGWDYLAVPLTPDTEM